MSDKQKTIDLTHAKNALYVRQAVALAFGLPIDREWNWIDLREGMQLHLESIPEGQVFLVRLPRAAGSVIVEARALLRALGELRGSRKDIEVLVWLRN